MEDFPVSVPKKAVRELTSLFIPSGTPPDASLQLVIRIEEIGFRVRDFSAYLILIDKTYGRLSSKGLKSYAQKVEDQLRVSSLQSGSFELVISEIIANFDQVTLLFVIGFFLKYLPNVIRESAAAYRDYEEARLARQRRRQLREQIRHDKEIEVLDDRRKRQLVELLDILYGLEIRNLPKAQRFSHKHVKEISFRVRLRNNEKKQSKRS
jgi:hypothetical protein